MTDIFMSRDSIFFIWSDFISTIIFSIVVSGSNFLASVFLSNYVGDTHLFNPLFKGCGNFRNILLLFICLLYSSIIHVVFQIFDQNKHTWLQILIISIKYVLEVGVNMLIVFNEFWLKTVCWLFIPLVSSDRRSIYYLRLSRTFPSFFNYSFCFYLNCFSSSCSFSDIWSDISNMACSVVLK